MTTAPDLGMGGHRWSTLVGVSRPRYGLILVRESRVARLWEGTPLGAAARRVRCPKTPKRLPGARGSEGFSDSAASRVPVVTQFAPHSGSGLTDAPCP